MKRFACALLAFCLLMSLCACGLTEIWDRAQSIAEEHGIPIGETEGEEKDPEVSTDETSPEPTAPSEVDEPAVPTEPAEHSETEPVIDEETDATAEVDEAAFFSSLPDFVFASGVGAWDTGLSISPDGSFTGNYHDSDFDVGEDYPNGTVYVCDFNGRFTDLTQVDEYTWSMRVAELTVEETPEEWIEDGVRYIASIPYGMEHADEVMVYLPGAPLSTLPEAFLEWVHMAIPSGTETLPFYGLYNVADEQGFSS